MSVAGSCIDERGYQTRPEVSTPFERYGGNVDGAGQFRIKKRWFKPVKSCHFTGQFDTAGYGGDVERIIDMAVGADCEDARESGFESVYIDAFGRSVDIGF